jgi:rhamnosyltransferase subunit B
VSNGSRKGSDLAKLLIATLGSLGDIRPFLAIALAARSRGHQVTFATSEGFARLVHNYRFRYAPLGPDSYFDDRSIRADLLDSRTGFATFMALSNLSHLEDSCMQLVSLASSADAILSTPFVMGAHLAAKIKNIPLVNCALSPATLLAKWGGEVVDPFSGEWRQRLSALRSNYGLPRRSFPQMERFSANMTLGAYPRCIGSIEMPLIKIPVEIGYPDLDEADCLTEQIRDELQAWIAIGPFVFMSFGSFVDESAEEIFHMASNACKALGLRLLFACPYFAESCKLQTSAWARVEPYLPHRLAMREAAVVIHHCGVGTLAAAISLAKPMIAVPFGLDQKFNSAILDKRGLAEVLARQEITSKRLQLAIKRCLDLRDSRSLVWKRWIEDDASRPAQRAIECVEALL